jgi:uncharacterized protein (TIRG00374 family)
LLEYGCGAASNEMTRDKAKSRLASTALRGSISIGLILVVVWNLDTESLRTTIANVSLLTLLTLTAIDLLLRILSAYRWHVLFRSTNSHSSIRETTRISFVASFLGQVLPGVIGVEALRVYGLARSSDDAAGAFASVVADRMFGLVSLVLVIFAGLLIGPAALPNLIWQPLLIVLAILVASILMITIPYCRRMLEKILPAALYGRIRSWVDKVYECFDHYKTQPALLTYSLVLALLFQLLRVMLFFAAALLIGESPAFIYFLVFVPIIMFAALLPISISGLGVREAGLVFFFTRFDVMDSAPAFTVAILIFLSGMLSTLPGGWYYMRQRQVLAAAIEQSR